jgi:hypothetical protein
MPTVLCAAGGGWHSDLSSGSTTVLWSIELAEWEGEQGVSWFADGTGPGERIHGRTGGGSPWFGEETGGSTLSRGPFRREMGLLILQVQYRAAVHVPKNLVLCEVPTKVGHEGVANKLP